MPISNKKFRLTRKSFNLTTDNLDGLLVFDNITHKIYLTGECFSSNVKDVSFNQATGVITLTRMNDTRETIDLGHLEKPSNKVTSISDQSTDDEYPSAKCIYGTLERKGEVVWEVQSVSDGILASETDLSQNPAWQLTNLDMTPYQTVCLYIRSGGTGNDTTASGVIRINLESMNTSPFGHFIGSTVLQNPNNRNRLLALSAAISEDKTKVFFNRCTSLYNTAATSANSDGRVLYKIVGYQTCIYEAPHDYSQDYLTFRVLTPGTVMWKAIGSGQEKTIQYSLNDGAWTSIAATSAGVSIPVVADDVIRFRGSNNTYANDKSNYSGFEGGTANFNVEGNIMSLVNGDNFAGTSTLSGTYNFCSIFKLSNVVSAKHLILPATTLAESCYNGMFSGCTSLTTAPALPATTLASECYRGMFNNCTSLTTVPSDLLPATTLAESCYRLMFQNCSALTTAPALPATTLAESCYRSMFNNCTSLTTVPSDLLPATTLASNCYRLMFQNCRALTTAPALPATTLAESCYHLMFNNCSLTTAPELPATTLAVSCYYQMFQGCTSLTTVPELPATTLAERCYYQMFNRCTSLTTVPELPATTLADYCYCFMFQDCTSLTTAPALPATTLADDCYNSMFFNCTSLNYIKCLATNISASKCTNSWVYGVASTGTFVKAASMSDWTTGTSGIPSGWTVEDAA